MKGDVTVKLPLAEGNDGKLSELCQEVAQICCSSEFKQLHKEMSKIYKKNGVKDPSRAAFQDSLFSMYLEQNDPEVDLHVPSF
jgi:hypothetical protein